MREGGSVKSLSIIDLCALMRSQAVNICFLLVILIIGGIMIVALSLLSLAIN